MRVIFMGTPDFAVPSLAALLEHGHEVVAVFTQPDKPKGRGHKLQPPPVKELAQRHALPVYQPQSLRGEDTQALLRSLQADVAVVAAYGKILPQAVLDIPRLGCVNVHGSLLPKYRGAAPIQWAVINGEKLSGITTMQMAAGVDTGDMLLQKETPIGAEETAGELFDRLKDMGAALLIETLEGLEKGTLVPIPQKEELATHAPMLKKEMSVIDWTQPAGALHNLIRGLTPWPGAVTTLQGHRLKLLASQVVEESGAPGEARVKDGQLLVCCGEKALQITLLQTDKGKRVTGESYLLGHPLCPGARCE